jgi:hypothetical protein
MPTRQAHPEPPPAGSGERPAHYGAAWRAGDGLIAVGGIEVGTAGMRLEGRAGDERLERTVSIAEIREVRIGRGRDEMLRARPTLLLELEDATTIRIEPLGTGLLHEVADLVAALAARAGAERGAELAVVVAPLRRGALEEARGLLAGGPPFDPGGLDLEEHDVFVGESEVVFMFRGRGARAALQRASRDPRLWRAGLAWRRVLGGAPRLLERAYTWSREPESP